jgi:hypothetical protein
MTRAGERITDIDITEISCTPVAAHGGTSFSVVQGKAIEYALFKHDIDNLTWLRDELVRREQENALDIARMRLDLAATHLHGRR